MKEGVGVGGRRCWGEEERKEVEEGGRGGRRKRMWREEKEVKEKAMERMWSRRR